MPQKKQIKLETDINEIVIVNNKKLTPYIELVNFSSKNIDQKKLGTILGIFEIKDTSEDSAYIVNFLSSVAKKTYFASHQKSPESSFESTLAKVNLSLSEVAKHGNINWVGKIDAVLCSIFENQIHFSVSGEAKVLLLRKDRLNEISAGLSPIDEVANPMKTFTDIASGKLEEGDKLILTTDDISHIFTIEDLEKHALSFSNGKFLRFLRTALVNELDIAGTIVIDTKKVTKKIKEPVPVKKEELLVKDTNLFGSTAFENNKNTKKEDYAENSKIEENKEEYTHKQTGHIYMKDSQENYDNINEGKFEEFINLSKEKLSDFWDDAKEKFFKKLNYKIKKKFAALFEKKPPLKSTPQRAFDTSKSIPISSLQQKTKSLFNNTGNKIKEISSSATKQIKSSLPKPSFEKTIAPPKQEVSPTENYITVVPRSNFSKEKFFLSTTKVRRKILKLVKMLYRKTAVGLGLIKKILPHLAVLKNTFLRMSPKLKLATLAIILLIFIVPLVLFLKDDTSDNNPQTANQSSAPDNNLAINPSSQSYSEAEELYKDSNLIGSFVFDNVPFAISKNKIIKIEGNNEEFSFPDNFRNATHYSFMNDLNLLFLINDKNQLISFSPISLKFKNDIISITEGATVEGIGTYLTYLYLVDSKNKQIYRYPRADEGFGEKIDWLSSDINFDNISDMAIDGNLYLTKKDEVIKLFNRKTQNFNLKKDENSSINGVFTNEDTSHIYILDNLNGELVKFDKNGNKTNSTSNNNLTQAQKIWVNEKEAIGYFTTQNSLFKIKLAE